MKTKESSKISDHENRILPVYRLILRKLFIYFLLVLPFFIFLPTFFAAVVSVLITLAILYTKYKKTSRTLVSPLSAWKKYGYKPYMLFFIVTAMLLILFAVNLFIQPVVFKLSVKIFYALF